jgi:two-component system KDP operon response regulator KdpE
VVTADDGEAGLHAFYDHAPDLVLLDVTMPRMSGFEVLREMRCTSNVPIIMLTAMGAEADQVRGLELGADDYIVKPFSHLALLARINVVLRRVELSEPSRSLPDFLAGDLAINFQRQQVSLRGEPVSLTLIEYRLLYHLVRNAGRLMPHAALIDRVWGADHGATDDYLKVYVSRLRAKLQAPGGAPWIETTRGLGYRFVRPRETGGETDGTTSGALGD